MNIFFVDYENVSMAGFKGIEMLSKNDIVYLFYSKNTPNLPMELVNKIKKSPAMVEMIETKVGKNAMDFVISTFLGYEIKERDNKATYYIVSKDKGYAPVIDFWESWTIKEITEISQINGTKKPKKINIRSRIGMLIKGLKKEDMTAIEEIITKGNKGTFCNMFKKKFKTKGQDYFNKLKPLFEEIEQ